jgi:hypothetical protein
MLLLSERMICNCSKRRSGFHPDSITAYAPRIRRPPQTNPNTVMRLTLMGRRKPDERARRGGLTPPRLGHGLARLRPSGRKNGLCRPCAPAFKPPDG